MYRTAGDKLTKGNALILASKLGAEHRSDGRLVYNVIQDRLLDEYAKVIREGTTKDWKALPGFVEVLRAAERGYAESGEIIPHRAERIAPNLARKFGDMVFCTVPKLGRLTRQFAITSHFHVIEALIKFRDREPEPRSSFPMSLIRSGVSLEASRESFIRLVSEEHIAAALAYAAVRLDEEVAAADAVEDVSVGQEIVNLVDEARSWAGKKALDATDKLAKVEDRARAMLPSYEPIGYARTMGIVYPV